MFAMAFMSERTWPWPAGARVSYVTRLPLMRIARVDEAPSDLGPFFPAVEPRLQQRPLEISFRGSVSTRPPIATLQRRVAHTEYVRDGFHVGANLALASGSSRIVRYEIAVDANCARR